MGNISNKSKLSYWQVFRLIFVICSLYLLGDAFYRLDGFLYYASFSEFIPSVALVMILWSIVAAFTALLLWLLISAFEWLLLKTGLKINAEQLLIFICVFVLLGAVIWTLIKLEWPYLNISFPYISLKLSRLAVVTFFAIFLAWLLRGSAERLVAIIQERITPLIWVFGLCVMLSLPVIVYETWLKQEDESITKEISLHSPSEDNRPNIILVIFDTLSARDMSVYGYNRETTPFITKWAKNASIFTRLKSEGNITTPTTASIMTGKRLWTHQTYQVAGSSKPINGKVENLPSMLKKNGYYNMAFVVNPFASVKKLDLNDSFDIAYDPTKFWTYNGLRGAIEVSIHRLFGDKIRLHDWIVKKDFILYKVLNRLYRDFSSTEFPPSKAFDMFFNQVDKKIQEPYFAWIHLYPPHNPYLPPAPYMGMFDESKESRTYKSQEKASQITYPYRNKYEHFPDKVKPYVNTLRARYDEFIRYSDKQFEDFIERLISSNKSENTVIIFTSDHGESFEHNYLRHGFQYLYEQVTHIPLIIKEKGQNEGRIINDLAEQIDIPATILDLANIKVPLWMEGRSLVPLMRGEFLPPGSPISMALESQASRGENITNGTIALWEDDYKLIHYLNKKKSQLFNLRQDPNELNNLFDKEPEIGHRLLKKIQVNLQRANEKIQERAYDSGFNKNQ